MLKNISTSLYMPGLWALLRHGGDEILAQMPSLRRLLKRIDSQRDSLLESEALLLKQLGWQANGDSDAPVAALERLALGMDCEGFWFRADPVNLQDDKNFLMMSYPAVLDDLTQEESESLVRSINAHFAEDGWLIDISEPRRWYLRLPEAANISTTPSWHVAGRDVLHYLPEGKSSRRWRAWLTEIQMLLHTHPVNQQRQARGQRPVNGLWFWGGGSLPQVATGKNITLIGKNAFMKGLALLSQNDYLCQDSVSGVPGKEQALLVDYARQALLSGSMENALQTLEMLDETLFKPLLRELTAGAIEQLVIIDCPGRIVEISSRGIRKWWRRRKLTLS